MNANTCPAFQRRAVRMAFGMEIWNLAESLAVGLVAITIVLSIGYW
jgi:hypothetical protein